MKISKLETCLVSNCCGAMSESGDNYDELNMCPECKDHCMWEEEEI